MINNDDKRFLDLKEWFSQRQLEELYTDFEGLSDPTEIVEKVDHALTFVPMDNIELRPTIRTIVIHYLYTNLDLASIEYSQDEVTEFVLLLSSVLSCRFYLKENR